MSRSGWVTLTTVSALAGIGAAPVHPDALNEKLQHYVAARVNEFEKIPEQRRGDLRKLAAYLRDKAQVHRPARLTFICTHNSRRSQICQIWAATAAAYYGLSGIEVSSGGTEVTAFNPRAVAALRRTGFSIEELTTTHNPRFRVRFRAAGPELECFPSFISTPQIRKRTFARC